MPIYGRHFEPGQLQFITTSTYRRGRLFTCQRFCWIFVETRRQLPCASRPLHGPIYQPLLRMLGKSSLPTLPDEETAIRGTLEVVYCIEGSVQVQG